jgi:hypothetical protein
MDLYDLHIARIISGELIITVGLETYVLKHPSRRDRYRAELVYLAASEESEQNGLYTEDELLYFLISNNLWSEDKETQTIEIQKDIEKLKIGMFENRFDEETVDKSRELLRNAERKLMELYSERHKYDHLTIDGVASSAKMRFLITKCLYYDGGKKKLSWDKPESLLNIIMDKINKYKLSNEIIRKLSRCAAWQSYWSVSKGNVFGKPAVDWTPEQKSLVSWSTLYDNLRKNPDFPSVIIDDDDMVDGWMLLNKEKNEAHLSEEDVLNSIHPSILKCREIFVMARNERHAKKIDSANSPYAKMIKTQRAATIKQHGQIHDMFLPDNQLEIQTMANSLSKG